jgi:CheY-like chemotaxis protein/anti-sigma regulatory factor (Ser/Thr protein kinase)
VNRDRDNAKEIQPAIHEEAWLARMDLASAVRQLTTQMRQRLGLRVTLDIQDADDKLRQAARIALFRAIRELLINVAKHAHTEAAFVGIRQTEHQITITVADQGKGFDAAEVLAREGSKGLGGIRERLAAMGGRLSVNSIPGQGSIVTLVAPLVLEPDNRCPTARHETFQTFPASGTTDPYRILVVDDSPPVRQGLVSLLEQEPSLTVFGQAGDGLETLALARQLHPDVVIMDIRLPKLNGIETTRQIKAEWPETVVIGLSAFGEAILRGVAQEADFSAVLDKADVATGLVLLIHRCLAARDAVTGETSGTQGKARQMFSRANDTGRRST